jgi:hypothetical protein
VSDELRAALDCDNYWRCSDHAPTVIAAARAHLDCPDLDDLYGPMGERERVWYCHRWWMIRRVHGYCHREDHSPEEYGCGWRLLVKEATDER